MLTKEDFFKQKIFFKENIKTLRTRFPENIVSINEWYCCEEYQIVQRRKSLLENKLKETATKDGADLHLSNEIIFDLYTWWCRIPKVCHYCGITENALVQLKSLNGFINKRDGTRGRSLEIDRKHSSAPYHDISNLTLACYWCNNAKTDTFTYGEFREIGRAINSIWQRRLEMVFKVPDAEQ